MFIFGVGGEQVFGQACNRELEKEKSRWLDKDPGDACALPAWSASGAVEGSWSGGS